MALPRPASPKALIADLRAFLAQRSRHQVIAACIAIAMPALIIIGFAIDARTNTGPGEQIVYVQSWRSDRTDAEIIADQKKAQAQREAMARERQRQFKQLEKRLGME